MKILLIEDDPMIGQATQNALHQAGHAVNWVQQLGTARHATHDEDYDVWILDLNLPDGDGLAWLAQQRLQGRTTPTLILSARGEVHDRVAGLNVGADDYLTKPFDAHELLARLSAITRRQRGQASPRWQLGELSIDTATREVSLAGQGIFLTAKEFAILSVLATKPNTVIAKARIEQQLYGWGEEVASNALDVHIHHLRRKLGPEWVVNVRGVGFKLQAPT